MKDIKVLCDQVRQTAYDIHVYHGHGHLEKVYENALAHRLRKAGLDVRQQHPIKVYDEDGTLIGDYLADLLVEGVLILELKTAKALAPEHEAQILGYLKSARVEHGLLINFGSYKFEIRKYVWSERQPQRAQRAQRVLGLLVSAFFAVIVPGAASAPANPYAKWEHGPPHDAGFFPMAVWLQDPRNAGQYRAAGFNTYVGLWKGPTEDQLAALKGAGMKVICEQNATARSPLEDPTIIGWMHGDEPDNAQSLSGSKGYGPPIPADTILKDYLKIQAADPSRPVMLNLGQGVAWDGWYGRGVRTNHPEDYPDYLRGCDIVSFDIYPVAHSHPQVSGKLWYVARGVERLVKWAGGQKVVWNCIECTRIQSKNKATPGQVRSEVWMSLIQGSMGLICFVHDFPQPHTQIQPAKDLARIRFIRSYRVQAPPAGISPGDADKRSRRSSGQ